MSILSNQTIIDLIDTQGLVSNLDRENVGSAYYELRMGNVYYDLTENSQRIELKHGQKVIIKPGHKVVLITEEVLKIPNNIIGRIISKGSFFSIGLSPVSTNADPGFQGNLGLVTQNFSNSYIEIPQKEGIGKIDFSLLDMDTTKPYVGQHGFQSKIWPIKSHLQKKHSDVSNDERVFSQRKEANLILPKVISDSIEKMESNQKKINNGLAFFIILNIFLIVSVQGDFFEPMLAFCINIFSSIFIGIYMQRIK
jgi:dCTP deaminase